MEASSKVVQVLNQIQFIPYIMSGVGFVVGAISIVVTAGGLSLGDIHIIDVAAGGKNF